MAKYIHNYKVESDLAVSLLVPDTTAGLFSNAIALNSSIQHDTSFLTQSGADSKHYGSRNVPSSLDL